jgi:hypothetical protein
MGVLIVGALLYCKFWIRFSVFILVVFLLNLPCAQVEYEGKCQIVRPAEGRSRLAQWDGQDVPNRTSIPHMRWKRAPPKSVSPAGMC